MTTMVGRHEPRKRRIIAAVRPAAIAPSRSTAMTEDATNTDWSNNDLTTTSEGNAARAVFSTCFTALTTVNVEALPFLMMLSRTERLPSCRTTFCWTIQPSRT